VSRPGGLFTCQATHARITRVKVSVHPDEERGETGLAKNRTASGVIHPISFGVASFIFY
jgi:hypothetical protein